MLLTQQERPRELKWYHAGPILYGDWGTSRFYVLGLAFYYSLHASFWFVLYVCALVAAVGWAYTIVCRCYPDGGGVYSAARHTSQVVAVVGALLLMADYIVTAALSALDGMHYLGIPDAAVPLCAILSIILIGVINYVGPKRAGTFALIVAAGTLFLTIILVIFTIPHLHFGWSRITLPAGTANSQWKNFVHVVLALSGVEAVANMTGVMVQPVTKTAKKTIWPVLFEVIILNIILAIGMNALKSDYNHGEFTHGPAAEYAHGNDDAIENYKTAHPHWQTTESDSFQNFLGDKPHSSQKEQDIKNKALRVMADDFVGHSFGVLAGIVFGLLLISAVNTAIGGLISIQYVMAHDRELPKIFTRLNAFGVPWYALIPAVAIPVILLLVFHQLEELADLYAIGVVGAIAINLGSCTINGTLAIKRWERLGLSLIAAIMIAIEFTLAATKPHALIFAVAVVGTGLGLRFVTQQFPALRKKIRPAVTPATPSLELQPAPIALEFGTPASQLDMSRPHIMVATRGAPKLLDFATKYASHLGGILFVIYVRQISVTMGPLGESRLDEDPEAINTFKMASEKCRAVQVSMVPIYVVSTDPAYTILDFAATYSVEALLMGVSRKGALLKALQGDTITTVAEQLPEDIPLLIHA